MTNNTIAMAGRIPADEYIDFSLKAKSMGWDIGGAGYKPNTSSISILITMQHKDDSDPVKDLWDLVPNLDGVIMPLQDLAALSDFDLESENAPDEDWW